MAGVTPLQKSKNSSLILLQNAPADKCAAVAFSVEYAQHSRNAQETPMTEVMPPPQAVSAERPSTVANYSSNKSGKPLGIYIVVAALTALILLVGYQQAQLARLSGELDTIRGDMRSGETRGHLEALDAKMQEMNTRLSYLDSKIISVDQKAQSALDKIKANEEKADWFGNILRGLGWK
jgi:uncharacterized protein HemX